MSGIHSWPLRTYRTIAALWIVSVAACTSMSAAPRTDSLYAELGGQAGISLLVDQLLERIADDARIAHFFGDTNIPRLRRLLVEQFCEQSGGPCTYTGDSMAVSHAHLALSEADFNALVEDLQQACADTGISVRTQNRLLARLAPMRGEILAAHIRAAHTPARPEPVAQPGGGGQ